LEIQSCDGWTGTGTRQKIIQTNKWKKRFPEGRPGIVEGETERRKFGGEGYKRRQRELERRRINTGKKRLDTENIKSIHKIMTHTGMRGTKIDSRIRGKQGLEIGKGKGSGGIGPSDFFEGAQLHSGKGGRVKKCNQQNKCPLIAR